MRLFQFIHREEDSLQISIPENLRGKYVRITVEECAPEDGEPISDLENSGLKQKEEALLLLDKLRNQLDVWDI
ncbi:MAG: hypothetical protein H6548_06525 [Chitinophagales bacterium]|nr:hypothetical protein [Chitinophagales bacterium]HAE13253.1 hypothetical protein [Bacteroidota bacterium]MCB9021755.1 hypothetical protein [Chitinophagales bacterium]MCB9030994.1 hypothetical protein [Chitinophagales bacterium]HAE34211.1 hypothetical protein [Bacteroidota bacterium]